jgi:leucyl-tRNA synthetase
VGNPALVKKHFKKETTMSYSPQEIEKKWQRHWQKTNLYRTPETPQNPYYVLEMFPYPSGQLHMGHVRNYALGDCVARFKRMQGYDVLHPMGFDAFGLPAENAAIKNGINPETWTEANIKSMIAQLQALGLGYDWERSLATCRPDYYKWNQWLFLKMAEKGLVYRKKGFVNWDPVDNTVLANEQVIDGKGWRSGAVVEKREIAQWYIKISDYAQALLDGLDALPGWPERVKTMQRNWIGRSEGTEIYFAMAHDAQQVLPVFTTRPDTLFGVTYVVLAPEHPVVQDRIATTPGLSEYVQTTMAKSNAERGDAGATKTGMPLGLSVCHPLTQKEIPLYVSDYVLMDYGTGAVMAVPAHDQRDYDFAKKFDLPLQQVITPTDAELPKNSAYTGTGILVNSGPFTGLTNDMAKAKISQALTAANQGKVVVQYRLRDWLISRQRYWGTPIPFLVDETDTYHPVPLDQLPVMLPKDVPFDGKGNPLAKSPEFMSVTHEGKTYRRETDTMDTFFDSSWYFLRYTDVHNTTLPFSKEASKWLPVQQYIGGIEHAVLHLLYARFFTKVLRDLGLHTHDEPFQNLLCQGMVLKDGSKMSKSVGNTVDPGHIITKYGADTARLFILFGAPVERDLEWSDSGVDGAFRFLNRVHRMLSHPGEFVLTASQAACDKQLHKTIQWVTEDIERFSFNTAISRMMTLVNWIYANGSTPDGVAILLQLLAPFAPFLAEEGWLLLGKKGSVHESAWPTFDVAMTLDDIVTVVIQVNGKVRDKLDVARDSDEATVQAMALASEKTQKFIGDLQIKKIFFVPNKLLNVVCS